MTPALKAEPSRRDVTLTLAASEYDNATDNVVTWTWDELVLATTAHDRRPDKRKSHNGALLGFSLAIFKSGPCDCGVPPVVGPTGKRKKGCPDFGLAPGAQHHGHRTVRNVVAVTALGLDFDKSTDGSDLTELGAREGRTRLRESGYAHVVYSSHSYAPPTKNNLRVVVQLSRDVTPDEWSRGFYGAAIRHLGIPSGIGDKPDPRRFWYLPSAPVGSPVVAEAIDGAPLDVDAILASIPTVSKAKERKRLPAARLDGGLTFADAIAKWCPEAWIYNHGSERRAVVECPNADAHSDGNRDAMVFEGTKFGFRCLHAHCEGLQWKDFRKHHEPDWVPFDERPPTSNRSEPHFDDDNSAIPGDHVDDDIAPPDFEDVPPADEEHARSYTSKDADDAEDFARDKDNRIYCTQANILIALRKLGVVVSYDDFARHELIAGLTGFGPRVDDVALRELRLLIDERFTFRIAKEFFYDVITRYARLNHFHPVREYLDGLTWDREPRISKWLTTYGNAPADAYTDAVSRLILVAAVRRIRQPGCKFDEMPVLESTQGTNKSTALALLAVRADWFADDLPLGGDTKELIEQTSGKWIVEAGELKGMNRSEIATLKSSLSRQVDEARLSYDRKPTIAPRQFVIIGTTNETEGYLKDSTGNRRFWPVRIKSFDLAKLARDRDQLWAEAAHAEATGESIRLDPKLYALAAVEQDDRRIEDPMVPILDGVLGDLTGKIRVTDALRIVGVDGRASQDQAQRLGIAMRELGWARAQRRDGGAKIYWYVKGGEHEKGKEIVLTVSSFGGRSDMTAEWRRS